MMKKYPGVYIFLRVVPVPLRVKSAEIASRVRGKASGGQQQFTAEE